MRSFLALFLVTAFGISLSVQAADQPTRKIVLIAGPKSHGPTGNGVHDYPWSVKLLKVMLDHSNVREQVRVEYHLDGMPSDLKTLDDADSIMVISDGRDGNLYQEAPHFGSAENLAAVQKQIDRGCGFLTFHFSTFAPDQYAKQILEWSGGYFDWETDRQRKWYSAITHKEADVEIGSPEHPVVRGVKPFKMKEEFYFNLRFADEKDSKDGKVEGLSPLFVVPALGGRAPDGNVVAWAKQRANGGRGFGTTCGHFYSNWERNEFRKLILNAIAWTAKLDVPKDGVEARYFTHAEITKALAGVEGTARSVIDERPIRVLLIAGNDAHKWHNWEKTTPAMKAALEKDPRIKVDVSLDIEDLAKKDIGKNYDILLPNYVNWHDPKPLSEASQTAFMNFVQNGGGVLFMHFNSSAFHFSLPMAAESDWPELRKIAIRVWNHHGKDEAKSGHDAFGPFHVDVTPLEHVITAGLKGFDVVDELYFKQDGRAVDPLITAKSKVTMRDEPLAFVGQYGKGKIFQTLLGHSEKTYDAFEPREMLRRAAAWAANRRVLKLRAEDDPREPNALASGGVRESGGASNSAASAGGSSKAPAASALRLTEGKFGQALDARSSGVSIEAKPMQRSVPLTVECWTKLSSKDSFNILIASEPKSSATHWEMYSYAGSGNYSVYLPGCGGEYRSDVSIADDKWHHVAMTLEAKRIRLFVDGKQVVDKPLPKEFETSKSGPLAIGRLAEGGIGCAGLIDEVRIRTGAHAIDALPEKAPVVDDNTVGLWRCDEIVEKTKLKDESRSATMAVAQAAVSAPAPAANQAAGGKPKPPAHWGKEQIGFDQWEGDWVDNRWKESQIGRWLSSVVGGLPGGAGRKMTSIRVGDQQQATVCFDAENAQVRAIWTGGFLKFNPARFGIIGAPVPDGGFMFQSIEHVGWSSRNREISDGSGVGPKDGSLTTSATKASIRYRGLHTHGERVVLSYEVDGVAVRESPWCEQVGDRLVVTRTIEVEPSASDLQLLLHHKVANLEMANVAPISLLKRDGEVGSWVGLRSDGNIKIEPFVTSGDGGLSGGFKVPASREMRRFKLVYWTGLLKDKAGWEQALASVAVPKPKNEAELVALQAPGAAKWTAKIETDFVAAANEAPYVVDTFKLPFDNPYKALLFTSGHDFFANGDIAVCTVHGDVWVVRADDSFNGKPKASASRDSASGSDAGTKNDTAANADASGLPLNKTTTRLRWHRFATGLHQPLGLVIVRSSFPLDCGDSSPLSVAKRPSNDAAPSSRTNSEKTDAGKAKKEGGTAAKKSGDESPHSKVKDAVYVLCRDQIVRLHDLNGDLEADHYECFSNIYPTSAGGHDYITCLERDSLGNFWFVHANLGVVRVSADGSKYDIISTGLRNPNGMGLGPGDVVTAAPQEGDWTPASAIFIAKPGAHFGGGGPRITPERPLGFDPPAVWIPRRVDNSSGGQCWVTSDKWGPLSGHMLHFSFGQCSAMLGIRRGVAPQLPAESRSDSATSPTGLTEFPFRFDSGAMRGRFSPHDGQLYVTGLRGWTTSAVTDGCLQRVRYTGQPIDMPVSATAYSNGIALSFTDPLDKDAAENPGSFHVEQWNYLYSKTYGSPEYRVSDPKQEGRDEVRVRSATLLDDRTVFLELKDVKPVNVMAVSCVLRTRSMGFQPVPQGVSATSNEKKHGLEAHATTAREFRRTVYLTLNSVRGEKFDESKLTRRATSDESLDANLKPGLIARFSNVGPVTQASRLSFEDARVDRMAATFVTPTQAASQFLKPGPFVTRWEGFLKVPLQQTVTFSVEGSGEALLFVNDKKTEVGKATSLNGGLNKVVVDYASPTDGKAARFRLLWKSADFAREPVPPTVLLHNSEDVELRKYERLRRGRELFSSLHCRNCHGPSPSKGSLPLTAPALTTASRHLDWIVKWLDDPQSFVKHAGMPYLFQGDREQALQEMRIVAASVDHLSEMPRFSTGFEPGRVAPGQELFENLSCVACHRLTPTAEADSHDRRSLAHLNQKYSLAGLAKFLAVPQRHAGARMPEFHLSKQEVSDLTAFLANKTPMPVREGSAERTAFWKSLPPQFTNDPRTGYPLLKSRHCVRCHELKTPIADDEPAPAVIPIGDVRAANGCLGEHRHQQVGTPWYDLAPQDRAALIAFLTTHRATLDQVVVVEESQRLVKTLRCQSCHDRDGVISPRRSIIADESESGLVPDVLPNLTWTGEKLRSAWVEKFLKSGTPTQHLGPAAVGVFEPQASDLYPRTKRLKASTGNEADPKAQAAPKKRKPIDDVLRPWLKGRMPAFPQHATLLAQGLAAEHGIDGSEESAFSPNPKQVEFGTALVQRTALDCRQCHSVGQQPAQGDDKTKIAPGINFALVKERVRQDYYQRFTLDPPRFDINTKMPKLAADGKKTKVTTILEGDARQQFDAIWHFIQATKFNDNK